jgi:probable HAF family extracellular repeat protein
MPALPAAPLPRRWLERGRHCQNWHSGHHTYATRAVPVRFVAEADAEGDHIPHSSRVLLLPTTNHPAQTPQEIAGSSTYQTLDDPDAAFGTIAEGINQKGDIVGIFFDGTFVRHGFLLHDGVYTTVDYPGEPLSTALLDINARGDVVGSFGLSPTGFLFAG